MELYFSSIPIFTCTSTNDKPQSPSNPSLFHFPNFHCFKKIKPFWGFNPIPCALNTQTWSLNCLLKPKPTPFMRPPEPALAPEPPPQHINQVEISVHIEKLVLKKEYRKALELFEQMPGSIKICDSTYDALIKASIALNSRQFAALLLRRYFFEHAHNSDPDSVSSKEFNVYLHNRLILMLVKCGLLSIASELFGKMPKRNITTFNIMTSGLVSFGHYWQAIEMFESMWKQNSNTEARMFATILRACAKIPLEYLGLQLHGFIAKKVYFDNSPFLFCAMMDVYAKCGRIDDAHKLFDLMPMKTPVGWNVMIAGYVLNGYSEKALDLYNEMKMTNVPMDMFTCATVIRVCEQLGLVEQGKKAHAYFIRHGSDLNLVVGTALVDFYGKWGVMEDARNVFDEMPRKNVLTWNALIGGYAFHGMGQVAIDTFDQMIKEGFVPNHITTLAVLTTCVYSGNFAKGRDVFVNMRKLYKINPRAMHYERMVDLLGRKGLLKEALNLIKEAPFGPNANMWAALLRACRAHNNTELGFYAAEKLYGLNPVKLSNYILLLNLYIKKGRIQDASRVLTEINNKGWELDVSYTWIQVKDKSYKFSVGDKTHPKKDEIYEKVDELLKTIGSGGKKTKHVFPDVCENELTVCTHHSEILAISFGLISTPKFTPLQLIQSHRICEHCHSFIGLVGLITKRNIVVRDSSWFHHFREGKCSCGGYW